MNQKFLSIVVPVYFEEKGLHEFYRRTKAVMVEMCDKCDHEFIFVNDGSTDKSWEILEELHEKDDKVKIINLSRNFGHQLAITAGMDYASGDAVVVIDDDLQDPPEVIPEMFEKWEAGYEVVYGVRKKRPGEKFWKLFTAGLFYKILSKLSNVELPLNAGDFRLIDRKVVDVLKQVREENRYIRGIISWIGFNQYGLPYERDVRYAGETTYTFKKLFRFAFDGIISFSEKPLLLASSMGVFITFIALLLVLYIFFKKIVNPAAVLSGWASTIIIILFMGGVQLLTIGVMGQYIGRIYSEVKSRPLYIIREKKGLTMEKDNYGQ